MMRPGKGGDRPGTGGLRQVPKARFPVLPGLAEPITKPPGRCAVDSRVGAARQTAAGQRDDCQKFVNSVKTEAVIGRASALTPAMADGDNGLTRETGGWWATFSMPIAVW